MATAIAVDSLSDEVLRLNVGGRSVRLKVTQILTRTETGRLAKFFAKSHEERVNDCDGYVDATQEYYFERPPTIFEQIVDFYVTGKLHRPSDVCPMRYKMELDYWHIPVSEMASCCHFIDDSPLENESDSQARCSDSVYLEVSCPPNLFDDVCLGQQRLVIWTFLENPRSSTPAKLFSIISALFVLLSLAGLILSSLPELQDEEGEPNWTLLQLENVCMIWFTAEYVARFLVHPCKWHFVRETLNIIDLLTIVPFYAEACLPLVGIQATEIRNFRGAMVVIRVMRVSRVARIFKLARYSTGLRAFGSTMKKSAAELSMLGIFLLTGIMLFSTAIYFFERDEVNSKFYSIPAACWWCVITMTTVGYGDMVPVTTGGKCVAALASVCGIIVLAFPISMIIDKFAESTSRSGDLPADEGRMTMRGRRRGQTRRYLF
uniref:BTB domain-containing protein n=1 Tax=Plectus sambesii TaxID=2011161 RepID=A0A914WTB5_9BILA